MDGVKNCYYFLICNIPNGNASFLNNYGLSPVFIWNADGKCFFEKDYFEIYLEKWRKYCLLSWRLRLILLILELRFGYKSKKIIWVWIPHPRYKHLRWPWFLREVQIKYCLLFQKPGTAYIVVEENLGSLANDAYHLIYGCKSVFCDALSVGRMLRIKCNFLCPLIFACRPRARFFNASFSEGSLNSLYTHTTYPQRWPWHFFWIEYYKSSALEEAISAPMVCSTRDRQSRIRDIQRRMPKLSPCCLSERILFD